MQRMEHPASKNIHMTSPRMPPQAKQMATAIIDSHSKLYELKEQLLLLTTLVATVTYVSGLNLPGGAWQPQQEEGHVAGDPILRDVDYRRYLAFYYCNATVLASSVVVCLILVMLRRDSNVWTVVLRVVMVLDLLGLMGSYAAGTCRDVFTTSWAVALACPVLAQIMYASFRYLRWLCCRRDTATPNPDPERCRITTPNADPEYKDEEPNTNRGDDEKKKIQVLMPLAVFVVTISYTAGQNPPGGFWTTTQHMEDGRLLHLAGDLIMQDSGLRRFRAFFAFNTTAFVASLLIILLLLDKKLSRSIEGRFVAVYTFIAVALLGLMGAYAAGSCRETDNSIKVISLAAAVPACVGLQLALNYVFYERINDMRGSFSGLLDKLRGSGERAGTHKSLSNARYFVMVLASLGVTITYQAGLDPPGGFWQDNLGGHKVGHPVLRTTHPARYQVFFYSNSAAFVTSLLVVMMVQSRFLLKRRTLVAAMVLDLIGLVIAYAAGSTRDASTSIYVVAIACLVLSYAVVHIALGGEKEKEKPPAAAAEVASDVGVVADGTASSSSFRRCWPAAAAAGEGQRRRTKEDQLEDKRQVLLLIAILSAALTYQAGLTPPGGFWPADDDKLGHRAGYPVLLDNYPRRYKAFFYCNAASFMASVALILLLVNRKLYTPGIRCYALHMCMAVCMFALMGAYASGSSRHLKTSIYVLTLVVVVSASIPVQAVVFWFMRRWCNHEDEKQDKELGENQGVRRQLARGQEGDEQEKVEGHEYLMLLGVLAASVTYQSGLRPPAGMWQEDNAAYSAGNPILHDINKRRYEIFWYSNSASFMASVIAIVMILPVTLTNLDWVKTCLPRADDGKPKWPLWPVHTAILLDMLGLLVAYAAGSTRTWKSSRNVIFLILPVLTYITVYAAVAAIYIRDKRRKGQQKP